MNFWLAFTQWLGGIGIVVMALKFYHFGVNIMRMIIGLVSIRGNGFASK
jgi:Trk-type K+ transport system membrane component